MHTTNQLIDLLRHKLDVPSDMQVALNLELGRQVVSTWRRGVAFPTDENALKIALALEMRPDYVMACIHADREKNPDVRSVWQRMAKWSQAAALSIIFGAALIFANPSESLAKSNSDAAKDNIHYTHMVMRTVRHWWRTLRHAFGTKAAAPQHTVALA